MTDQQIFAVVVAFVGTWGICAYLAFWIDGLCQAVKEVRGFVLELANELKGWGR